MAQQIIHASLKRTLEHVLGSTIARELLEDKKLFSPHEVKGGNGRRAKCDEKKSNEMRDLDNDVRDNVDVRVSNGINEAESTCWSSRIVDRAWHKLLRVERSMLSKDMNKKTDNDASKGAPKDTSIQFSKEPPKVVQVNLVNDISFPNSYKVVGREEMEDMLVDLWGEYLKEMEEEMEEAVGGSMEEAMEAPTITQTFSLSYKRPTAVIASTSRSSVPSFSCHHMSCSYRGIVRDLRHHYCGKHGATWNEAVMETMKYQDDMLVIARGGEKEGKGRVEEREGKLQNPQSTYANLALHCREGGG